MSAAVVGLTGLRAHRRVEQVMGMPISVALRGRHSAASATEEAWQAVVEELRGVDRVFSTYRPDSMINRLDRGEVTLGQCPPEVAEVLVLGSDAEDQSDGTFSITLPDSTGRRRLDPSGVVKGWAVERAARHLAALDDTDFCLSAGGDLLCVMSPTRTVLPGGSASSTRTTRAPWSRWCRSAPALSPPLASVTGGSTSGTPGPAAPPAGSPRSR